MPARSGLKQPDPVRVAIAFGAETVTVDFDRNGFTENWLRRLQAGIDQNDLSAASRAMVEILLGWDLVEEDGTPTPVAVDVFADLPFGFIRALDEAIGDAAVPSSEEGNDFAPISSTASTDFSAKQETRPNGPVPSPSPTDSESLSPT